MRITKIEVCDFRSFPGPAIYDFEFGTARNLLIYGENGSGKSSLFRAVQEFFNRTTKAKPFADFKNIDRPELTEGHVAVHFDSGDTQHWQFGGARPLTAPPASQTALQIGCLDYRSLLETNFSQKGDTVNLFDIAVNHLVDRMDVPVEGGGSARIGDLWKDVLASRPWANYRKYVQKCERSVGRFNSAFEPILTPLMDQASTLLRRFPGCRFDLGVSFQPVEYELMGKTFAHQELILLVKQGGVTVPNHHDFFNEAKLSAIALVIYLAGLLRTVPPASTYPKLLVLDDVLIGLDMENRVPVLDVLAEYFADWQVILMTHDKVWYEMIQLQLDCANWKAYELYVGEDQSPRHHQREGGSDYYLVRARRHLATNDLPSAANYTRAAFEWKLKTYCDKHSVPVPYKKDARAISADAFWQAAKKHALERANDPEPIADLGVLFADIELWKRIVLNPLSHSATAPVTRPEVQCAIDAVQKLRFK